VGDGGGAGRSVSACTDNGRELCGKGQVWVNTASNFYHCPDTRWYGKTKKGEYMSEAAAKAEGARPDHGKPCGS
jgi:hypothetical protein